MDKNVTTIIQKLKKIPHCEGIVYAGSRTDGDFVATSDYDFTVLVSKGKSYFKIFWYKGLLVDMLCTNAEVIEKQDFVRNKVANAELSIMAHGEIVYDKSGKMAALQKKAKKVLGLGPKKDTKEAGHLCTTFLHRLNKPHSEVAHHSWNVIMDKTTQIFFELHGVWLPKFLKVEQAIKETDKDFFKLYEKAFNTTGKDRVKATKQIIQYLVKKFDLPQTGELYISKD